MFNQKSFVVSGDGTGEQFVIQIDSHGDWFLVTLAGEVTVYQ